MPRLAAATLSILGLFIAAIPPAQAAVVARYDFTGTSLNSSDADPSTASALSTVGLGTPYINPSVGFPSPSITITADNIPNSTTNPPSAPAPGETTGYFTFTITPVALTALDFTTFSFDISNGTTSTLVSYVLTLQTSLDGFQNVATSTVISGLNNFTPVVFDVSSLPNATGMTEFRLLVRDNSTNPSSGLLIDNIVLNGNLAAIPEPSSWAMIVVGAGVLMLVQRFRRRA